MTTSTINATPAWPTSHYDKLSTKDLYHFLDVVLEAGNYRGVVDIFNTMEVMATKDHMKLAVESGNVMCVKFLHLMGWWMPLSDEEYKSALREFSVIALEKKRMHDIYPLLIGWQFSDPWEYTLADVEG